MTRRGACHPRNESRSRTKSALSIVSYIEEAVFVLLLLVDCAHQGRIRRKDIVDENENCFLGRKLDPLPDDMHELANCIAHS
jgi:hypothetical protein